MAGSGVTRRHTTRRMADYAEFTVGPAKGRTRWLIRPAQLRIIPRILDCPAKPGNDTSETQVIANYYRAPAAARPARTGTRWARNSAEP